EQFGVSNFGHPGSYYPPYWPAGNPYPDAPPNQYLTDRLADDGVAYLQRQEPGKPFLAAVFFYNVHTPHSGRKHLVARYRGRGLDAKAAEFAAMLEAVDDAVGRILAAVRQTDTVTVLLGDQGGYRDNAPLRGSKQGGTTLYEGGSRVPFLIRWPEHVA